MAKLTLKLDTHDLSRILKRGLALEQELMSDEGDVYNYILTIGNGYKQAVISGMGKTIDGTLTLKSFLGQSQTVKWEPNSEITRAYKRLNGWDLKIWKASGAAESAVEVISINSGKKKTMYAGIDQKTNPEAYLHALNTEFGASSDPGNFDYEGRALFTLLSAVFEANTDKIVANINRRIRLAIRKTWER